jgi:hypothetical protein
MTENDKFTQIALQRHETTYYPAFKVGQLLNLSGLAVAKITSSFMVLTSDGQKNNLGLSIKFEAKGMKVLEYSRKDGRNWEFSEKALALIREYKVNKTPKKTAQYLTCFPGALPGSFQISRLPR